MKNPAATNESLERDIGISFDRNLIGYNKVQVDRYIGNLVDAYQTAYDEYNAKCSEYDELLDNYRTLAAREKSHPGADIITKTLLDAELLTQTILSEAREEAKNITEESYVKKFELVLQAQATLNKAKDEAATMKAAAQKALSDATREAARIREESHTLHKSHREDAAGMAYGNARQIIEDARAEAARIVYNAKLNEEQFNENIRTAMNDMRELPVQVKPVRSAS
ncbi:MAG: DivIVA domain-containing protein [Oscillospiraceae bacterium]|nr:DivIVA domain-containing protein [Oscillospiraceae bacterium]